MQSESSYPKLYFYRRIVQAKLYIDQHYAEDIELFSIAHEAHYSKYHFIRNFKAVYGRTPHQYLTFIRIEQARRLLAEGMPVTDVCYAVGFEEPGSFSRLFKRHTGINPSIYLAQQHSIRERIAEAPLSLVPHCFAYQYGWTAKSATSDK